MSESNDKLSCINGATMNWWIINVDEETWEKCIPSTEAAVKRNHDQIDPTNYEPKATKALEKILA